MALALVEKGHASRPGWREFVGGTDAADIDSILERFPTGTDLAVMQTLAHCYRVKPPGLAIRTAVVRWLKEWRHEDIVAASYMAGLMTPTNPIRYMDAILTRWATRTPTKKRGSNACDGCGGELGLDSAGYQGRRYCATCWDTQAWRYCK